jgi:glycosyltransferase involved in cell wall biosynthesis
VSICVPVYNGARYIAETLRSALAQDFTDFELVISDNASTDDTADIVAGMHDPRIVYDRSPRNVGAVGNFNRCLELARGRYLKILCADDLLYPSCLSRQVAILEQDQHRSIALVSSTRDIIDTASRIRWHARPTGLSGRHGATEAIRSSVRSGTNIFGEPLTALFRTEQGRQAGGFNPAYSFCLDLDFWFRLLALGDVYHIQEPLSAFRVSATSWSTGLSHQQANEFRRFVESYNRSAQFLSSGDLKVGIRRAILNAYFRRLFYLWMSFTNVAPSKS